MTRVSRRLLLATSLATVALGGAAAASASAAVTLVTAKPVAFKAPVSTTGAWYEMQWPSVQVYCPRNAAPLAAGWTGPAYISPISVAVSGTKNGAFNADVRLSALNSGGRATALCARGLKSVTKKRSSGTTVSCGRNIALGLPLTNGTPRQATAAVSKPLGVSRWTTTIEDGWTEAICVSRASFTKVRTVSKAGTLAAGQASTSVTATCPSGYRALAWGYELPVLAGYEPPRDINRHTPFVSGAALKGTRAWTVSFTTPEATPAGAPARVVTHAVCGIPAR